MIRTAAGAVVGFLLGAVLSLTLLRYGPRFVRPELALEVWIYYVVLTLGAGFGGVCGALAGLAGAVVGALRREAFSREPPASAGGQRSPEARG